jgi:N-acetyl sugar amidotransferase
MTHEPRTCTRCVMDTTATGITFDAQGVCNYCTDFVNRLEANRASVADPQARRDEFIARIKADGEGKEYDCIVGISGGVDSSYVLYLAVKHGLRPLAVHLDNGWNSELAAHNIASLVNSLGVDLYTHVIDWEENRDMQLSLFKANVVDIELLTDNALITLNYQQAAKYGIKYILSGSNTATEGLAMPQGWNHLKYDARNIRAIHKKFGTLPIRTHPLISVVDYVWYEFVRRIKWLPFLDYFPYNKFEAIETLQKEVGYKPYPYKHYESVFTRFYQAYILPRKFGYDKRRVHLATLVASGQMPRTEAMQLLAAPTYPDPRQEQDDLSFVMKKLGFTEESFQAYIRAPGVPHAAYPSEVGLYKMLLRVYKAWRGY